MFNPDMAAQLLDAFAAWQKGRGFSRATVRRRTVSLNSLARHIAPLDWEDATPALIEEWLQQFTTAATRRAYLADVRVFYRWAYKRGLVPSNPTEVLDSVKVPRTLPRPVASELVPLVVLSAPNWRIALMCALAAYAGMRRAEIARLEWGDVNLSSRPPTVTVRDGKGGKDRAVPLHPEVVRLFPPAQSSGPVFGLSPDRVGKLIADHLRECGVPATAHQLRHSFGTELARHTPDVLMVAQLMGHATVATTMGYVSLAGRDSAPAVAAMYHDSTTAA